VAIERRSDRLTGCSWVGLPDEYEADREETDESERVAG
jgi:hypothetical protein